MGNKRISMVITVTFAEFWSVWPKKDAKLDAEKAWNQQIKKGYRGDDILAGVRAFVQLVAQRGTDRTFIPLPASWLRAGRWMDDDLRVSVPDDRASMAGTLFDGNAGGEGVRRTGCADSIARRIGTPAFDAYFRDCEFTDSSVIAPTPARRDYIINKFRHLLGNVEITCPKR